LYFLYNPIMKVLVMGFSFAHILIQGAYLEELVHAFMNARNEELTHKIVELLYPCVKHSAEYGFVKR
ncbi:hypothetical protein Q7513_04610, partial [Glaesserella parasuis]|nr:hypothetical protein [Glaesserella parasuis]